MLGLSSNLDRDATPGCNELQDCFVLRVKPHCPEVTDCQSLTVQLPQQRTRDRHASRIYSDRQPL